MTFLAPAALWGLLAIPVLAFLYIGLMRQRSRSNPFGPNNATSARASRVRRILPPTLLFIALAGLLFSFARPVANISLPVRTGQIVFAFDTSNSMLADDVEPTRLERAKTIALNVVEQQPGSMQIGVVAFTNGGLVVQAPTSDQGQVREAIDRLTTDGGTSIGEGIFAALTSIADRPIEMAADDNGVPDLSNLDIGFYTNAAIIVLTDGEEIGGADPFTLAELSSNSGVPIYTVGIGTPRGTVVALDGFSIATALDETVLTEVAELTGGQYFLAETDPELTAIFDDIDRSFEQQGERIEVTGLVAAAAMVVMAIGGALSLRWLGRL